MLLGLFGIAVLFILATYQPKIFLDGKKIGLMLLLFAIGATLYWGTLLYWTITLPPTEVEKIADIVTGREQHRSSMFVLNAVSRNLFLYLGYLFYQFPLFGFFMGFIGFYSLYRNDKRLFGFLFLALISNTLFTLAGVSSYGNANYTFYIHDYVIFAIAIGCGLDRLLLFIHKPRPAMHPPTEDTRKFFPDMLVIILLFITPITMYTLTPRLVKRFNIDLIRGRGLTHRDNNDYFLNPNKRGYRGPADYAEIILNRAEQSGAIVISDFTPCAVLTYFNQVKGVGPNVEVVYTTDAGTPPDYDLFDFVEKNIDKRPIYLTSLRPDSYNLTNVEKKYTFREWKPVWEIRPKELRGE
jgi:hypothetical protein